MCYTSIVLTIRSSRYGQKNTELGIWKPKFIPDSASNSPSDLR